MDSRFQKMGLALVAFAAVTLAGTHHARGQFPKEGLDLFAHMPPSDFGASEGNDIWGYVSPSGREYALVSLNNQLAVVEITNPRNPVKIGNIPHNSCTWGDVKVYKDRAYEVSECNTGIQVIDLSDVDNGNVRLERTIGTPGSTHNVVVNTESGYLFTVGSGRTYSVYIFDLDAANGRNASPGNPVFVEKFRGDYQHDAQVVTYDKGLPEERQVLFGASERRGVQVYELKFNNGVPSWRMIGARSYPSVQYSHQVWLDADRQYLYGDDELDELRGGIPTTRTLVFDVSDPADPQYVTSFTSGQTSIDHNLYVKDGLIFEANYTSGVRVFDTRVSKTNPPQIGFFDTHPEATNFTFNGIWSLYPYFPSGTLIGNDINRGFFVLDTSGLGGGISCDEVRKFKGKCKNGKAKAKVKLRNTDHDGENVTIEVNGSPIDVPIAGRKAKLVTCCFEGSVKLELVSPAGCADPVNAACN